MAKRPRKFAKAEVEFKTSMRMDQALYEQFQKYSKDHNIFDKESMHRAVRLLLTDAGMIQAEYVLTESEKPCADQLLALLRMKDPDADALEDIAMVKRVLSNTFEKLLTRKTE